MTPEFPKSLIDFQKQFSDDASCRKFLIALRWPNGFECPHCNFNEVYHSPERIKRGLLRCRRCFHDSSITAGTIMHRSRIPLHKWIWSAYLMTTNKVGISALQLQKQLNIKRYETAWILLHKLRSATIAPNRLPLKGDVEVDESAIGGGQLGHVGRDFKGKTIIVAAVERRDRTPNKNGSLPKNRRYIAGRIRLQVISDMTEKSLIPFIQKNVCQGAHVITDGWQSYNKVSDLNYYHTIYNTKQSGKLAHELLPLCHIVFSNLKTWLLGTHHGRPQSKHMQSYLNEYVFRFNRRHNQMASFRQVLALGENQFSPTYKSFYSKKI